MSYESDLFSVVEAEVNVTFEMESGHCKGCDGCSGCAHYTE